MLCCGICSIYTIVKFQALWKLYIMHLWKHLIWLEFSFNCVKRCSFSKIFWQCYKRRDVLFFIVLIHVSILFRILFVKFPNMFGNKILTWEYMIIIYEKRKYISLILNEMYLFMTHLSFANFCFLIDGYLPLFISSESHNKRA